MASNYQFVNPAIGEVGISATGTYATSIGVYPPFPFGFMADAVDASYGMAQFMFVRGPSSASSVASGDAVMIQGSQVNQLVSGSTASQGPVGVIPADLSNTNVYGWAQVYGVIDYAKMGTQGTAAKGLPVVIGTTAGRLQSTAGATGYIINGLKVNLYSTTANSNSAILNAYYPVYDGRNQ